MRWSSMILMICFFLNMNAGFLLQNAFALTERPQTSKVKRSSHKKTTPIPPVMAEESFFGMLKEYVGIPYRWGGASQRGMDCSGFVKHIYSKTFTLDLPHSSCQQYSLPIMKKVPKNELRPGDLVFFSLKGKRVNHVGIYLDDGEFIHAGRKSGVTISSLDNQYWKLRMVCAKRHGELWGKDGIHRASSVSAVEIALNDSGEISQGYARSAGEDISLSSGLRHSFWRENASVKGRTEGLIHTFGLQLSHSFGDASWSMSLLQEGHFYHSSERTDYLSSPQPTFSLSERQYTLDRHLQGVRMAGDIHPVDWLQITPSLSYVGYENSLEDSASWQPGVGLAIRIQPLPARWSFSADLQYWDEGDRFTSNFKDMDSWQNSNLSLMFGYDLSKALRLSIVGQHGIGSLFNVKQNASYNRKEHKGLFLGLDWAF